MKQPVGSENTCVHFTKTTSYPYAIFSSTTVINPHPTPSKSRLYFFPTRRQRLNKIEMYIGLIFLKKWGRGGNSWHAIHPTRTGSTLPGVNPDAGDKAIERRGMGVGGREKREGTRGSHPPCSSKVHTPCSSKLTGTKIAILRSSSFPLGRVKNIHGPVSREHLRDPLRHVKEPFGNGAGGGWQLSLPFLLSDWQKPAANHPEHLLP